MPNPATLTNEERAAQWQAGYEYGLTVSIWLPSVPPRLPTETRGALSDPVFAQRMG